MEPFLSPEVSAFEELTRAELISIILDQRRIIAELQKRIAELEDHLGLGGGSGTPPISIKASRKPKEGIKKRKPRHLQFSRRREPATRTVDHTPDACPDCGRHLSGGGPGHSRQIIDFVSSPVEVVEHVLHDRWCGVCRKRVRANVDFSGYVSGKRRIGHNLASWISYLHITARITLRTIQSILKQMFSVHVSIGEMCDLMALVARKAKPALDSIKHEVRTSDCLHADETGWRENGEYRCLWSLSTKASRWFHIDEHRSADVAMELIGEQFSGTLVSDFYAVYNKFPCRHQRCWPHFHRDLEKLRLHPLVDRQLEEWIDGILNVWRQGREYRRFCLTQPKFGADVFDRRRKRAELERELTALTEPYWETDSAIAPQATLARRAGIFMNELFTFVEFPEVPDDNNAAERAIRPAVITRKICGGTRSNNGTRVKAELMSLFATWKLQGADPIQQCRILLANTT
jgi:transposase